MYGDCSFCRLFGVAAASGCFVLFCFVFLFNCFCFILFYRGQSVSFAAASTTAAAAAAAAASGLDLLQLSNEVTKETSACFEPAFDYVVTKVPRQAVKRRQFGDS